MTFEPCVKRVLEGGELVAVTLGAPVLDEYLEFVAARGALNSWLAMAYDLKVFFEVVGKSPAEVASADVFAFLAAQRAPRRGEKVVRIEDGGLGWRRARSLGACRAWRACSSTCSLGAMLV